MIGALQRTWPTLESLSMRQESDEALVRRTKAGEAEAFSELARRHERVVYNLAYRFMRDATTAEDMAQEAFLKAFRLLGGFRGDSSFSTWLYRVTSSVCLTELAKRKRRAEVPLGPEREKDIGSTPAPEATDVPELIRGCVAQLSKRYAEVITLYYIEEISYDEICQILNVPMGTLKTWMHRARHALKKVVEKELSDHGLESF
jgi:RNA polymerase sigma-70 factor, ECF subfamily